MTPCEVFLDHLEDAVEGQLPAHLDAHLAGCAACQDSLRRARVLRDGAAGLAVSASRGLREYLHKLPRLAPACEAAQELLRAALDGELGGEERARFLAHLHACPTCRGVWEAFATLREVGMHTRAPGRLRASLALPPRDRVTPRRRQPVFNLRLATAAAYLLAAATVVLIGNPGNLARASNTTMERAGVYARAAVENRLDSYTRKVREGAAAVGGWLRHQATSTWEQARNLAGARRANPAPGDRVVTDGDGGTS
ncbi:MAG: zf-HC2 domain-containing protein [Acidobacteriota bacterium]